MSVIYFNCDLHQGSENYGLCVKSNLSPIFVQPTIPCGFYKTEWFLNNIIFNRTFAIDLTIGDSNFESQLSNIKSQQSSLDRKQ